MRLLTSDGLADDDAVGAFRALPEAVYCDDPVWVPQSESAVTDALDRARQGETKVRVVAALADGEAVARVMAILDPGAGPEGWVGLFECRLGAEHAGVAALGEARRWLAGRGAATAVGPRVDALRAGLLIEGFDRPQTVFTAHNPAFYLPLFEAAGFAVTTRMYSFVFHRDRAPTFRRLPGDVVIRHPDPTRLDDELAAIEAFQGEVFAGRGRVPRGGAASRRLMRQLLPVLDLDLVVLAEDAAGALAGVLVCVPDVWQEPPLDRARLISVGVLPGWRGRRVAMSMGADLAATLIGKGYQTLEGSWVRHDNRRPQVLARALGAERGRVFALLCADLRR